MPRWPVESPARFVCSLLLASTFVDPDASAGVTGDDGDTEEGRELSGEEVRPTTTTATTLISNPVFKARQRRLVIGCALRNCMDTNKQHHGAAIFLGDVGECRKL
jgi:hypothetical protein